MTKIISLTKPFFSKYIFKHYNRRLLVARGSAGVSSGPLFCEGEGAGRAALHFWVLSCALIDFLDTRAWHREQVTLVCWGTSCWGTSSRGTSSRGTSCCSCASSCRPATCWCTTSSWSNTTWSSSSSRTKSRTPVTV